MTHRLLTLATALGWLIGIAVTAGAGQDRAPSAAAPQEAKAPGGGGMGEGVRVHGRWTIDVRNPDGTLASHHEFDNALVTSGEPVPGNAILAGLLGRTFDTVRTWIVVLDGSSAPCGGNDRTRRPCALREGASAPFPPGVGSLRVEVPTRPVQLSSTYVREIPVGSMELSGEVLARLGGTIGTVMSALDLCNPADTDCVLPGAFTAHTLASPIVVAEGQIVQVRVIFSFS